MAGFLLRGRIPGMKHRKLRIAWSGVWGIAAVLLMVQWVQNYWSGDFYVYWFAILMSAALTKISWFKWSLSPRFSIRSMLFATTLVAVVMGVVVYTARK
jgi:hypothetical protein